MSGWSRNCRASIAIRSSRVEMGFEPDVSSIFPSHGSMSRRALYSTGSLGSVPLLPRYYDALRRPAAPLSLRLRSRFAVPSSTEQAGPPKFLGDPRHARPGSSTPVESQEQDLRDRSSLRFAPSIMPSEPTASSASTTSIFRGPIPRLACSLSTLRDPGRPRSSRKTRFRLAALPWPGGSQTRWVALQGFESCLAHMKSSLAKLSWRTVRNPRDHAGSSRAVGWIA